MTFNDNIPSYQYIPEVYLTMSVITVRKLTFMKHLDGLCTSGASITVGVTLMATSTSGERLGTTEGTFTPRTYHAGGFLLMLGGVISAIVGLVGLIASATGGLFGLSALVTGVIGGYVLVFGVIQFAAGASAYRGHNWYGSMTGGVLGMLGIVTLPLDLIAVILIALGEGEFDHEREREVVTTPKEET